MKAKKNMKRRRSGGLSYITVYNFKSSKRRKKKKRRRRMENRKEIIINRKRLRPCEETDDSSEETDCLDMTSPHPKRRRFDKHEFFPFSNYYTEIQFYRGMMCQKYNKLKFEEYRNCDEKSDYCFIKTTNNFYDNINKTLLQCHVERTKDRMVMD